jgi:hypothetical protein
MGGSTTPTLCVAAGGSSARRIPGDAQVRLSVIVLCAVASGCAPECGQRKQRAERETKLVYQAARLFANRQGHSPDSIATLAPPDCARFDGGCLLGQVPIDPWGEPYRLSLRDGGPWASSCGPDRKPGNEDDVVYP